MIAKEAIELTTFDGFLREYYKNLAGLRPCEAYEKTEKRYFEHFGRNKYSNYDTFRASLSRFLKKKNC